MAAAEDDVRISWRTAERHQRRAGRSPVTTTVWRGCLRILRRAVLTSALGVLSTAVDNPDRDAYAQGVDGHYLSRTRQAEDRRPGVYVEHHRRKDGLWRLRRFRVLRSAGVTHAPRLRVSRQRIDLNDLGYLERNDSCACAHRNAYRVESRMGARKSVRHARLRSAQSRRTVHRRRRVLRRPVDAERPFQTDDARELFAEELRRHQQRRLRHIPGRGRAATNVRWDSDPTQLGSSASAPVSWRKISAATRGAAKAEIDWRPSDRFDASLGSGVLQLRRLAAASGGSRYGDLRRRPVAAEVHVRVLHQRRSSSCAPRCNGWASRPNTDQVYLVPLKPGELVRVPDPAGAAATFRCPNLIFQARYRWEIAPLSELFVVLTIQANQTRALGDSTSKACSTMRSKPHVQLAGAEDPLSLGSWSLNGHAC